MPIKHARTIAFCAALAAVTALNFGSCAFAQGFKRTLLQTTTVSGTPYIAALYTVDIDTGAAVPPHTHPGIETAYILEGELDLKIEGQEPKHLKAGESFQIPAGTVHSAAPAAKPIKLLVTYVVEKDKPLATMVPQK